MAADDELHWLALRMAPGLGARRANLLLDQAERFGERGHSFPLLLGQAGQLQFRADVARYHEPVAMGLANDVGGRFLPACWRLGNGVLILGRARLSLDSMLNETD